MDNDPTTSVARRRTLDMVPDQSTDVVRSYIKTPPWVKYAGLALTTVLTAIVFSLQYNNHLVIMAAIMLASIVSSIAGFAFSAICGAMLFHIDNNPVWIVQLMMTCSIANQLTMTWMIRNDIVWNELRFFLAGGGLGLFFGVWLLLYADRNLYVHAFGAFLTIYGVYMLVRKPMLWRWPQRVLDFAVGVLGGITGGAAGFPGAFVTIWCGMKGWHKDRQRAVVQPFILIMQVAAILSISLTPRARTAGVGFDLANLLFVPASLLGTALGMTLYKRLSDHQFTRAVNLLLMASGLGYLL